MNLEVTDDSLNAITVDRLFASASPLLSLPSKSMVKVTVDLRGVRFIEPYGLGGLMALLETVSRRSKSQPKVLAPEDLAVHGYLSRLGAWEQMRKIARLEEGLVTHSGARGSDSDVLLELTPIRTQEDIDGVLHHLKRIVTSNLGYSTRSVNAILNTLSELCHNVVDHSESAGWAVAQRYFRSNDGTCFVRIGVADTGIGIKASLGKRFKTVTWSHFDAIVNALKKEFSRYPNRGMGLPMVGRIVNEFDGSLHVRSGDCRLSVGRRAQGISGAWFPGTLVGIVLAEHPGA